MKRHALIFGGLAGLILLGLMVGLQYFFIDESGKLDMTKGEYSGYLSMIVALSMIFFGIRSFRDQHLQGEISFGNAFKVGLMITLVASVIYVAGWMLLYNLSPLYQSFPEQYLDHMVQQWKENGMAEAELAKKTEEFRKQMELYKNPLVMTGMTFVEIFPVGLLIDLLSAFILRRKKQA
jgi:Protein of unknown function (DUF4199)